MCAAVGGILKLLKINKIIQFLVKPIQFLSRKTQYFFNFQKSSNLAHISVKIRHDLRVQTFVSELMSDFEAEFLETWQTTSGMCSFINYVSMPSQDDAVPVYIL